MFTMRKTMRKFDIRNINTKNTYEWTRCNNDSRSIQWRGYVLKYYGGSFEQIIQNKGRYWKWVSPPKNEANRWVFVDPEGKEHMVSNFNGFCKENKLDNGRMYDTYTGKRKHHKQWIAKKLYGVETPCKSNQKDFGRNYDPPARS
jgi:hypothetical protein